MPSFRKRLMLHVRDREYRATTLLAIGFLIISLVCNYYAGTYATHSSSNSVTDLILDNIPVYDISLIFIYGTLIFWTLFSLFLIQKPDRIPFVLKSISLFTLVRSLFVMLTHIAPPAGHVVLPVVNALDDFTFGGDLFFSGHTGLPFLLCLIFWEIPPLRYIFLAVSVFFATLVLLGHVHYSIDVLAAYFITYTIFQLCQKFFHKDQMLFKNGLGWE